MSTSGWRNSVNLPVLQLYDRVDLFHKLQITIKANGMDLSVNIRRVILGEARLPETTNDSQRKLNFYFWQSHGKQHRRMFDIERMILNALRFQST